MPSRPSRRIVQLFRVGCLVALASSLFFCSRRCSPGPEGPAGPAVPLGSAVALEPPTSIDPPAGSGGPEDRAKAPAERRTADELVTAAIGRWESPDGSLEIAVDPPHPGSGKRPPYHLVVTKTGTIPYGCEFSDPARVRIPGLYAVEGYELTFRAWCGSSKAKDTYLALALDAAGLRVAITVGHATKLTSGPLVRRATH